MFQFWLVPYGLGCMRVGLRREWAQYENVIIGGRLKCNSFEEVSWYFHML